MRVVYHHRTQARRAEGVHIWGLVDAFRRVGSSVSVVGPPGVGREVDARNDAAATRSGRLAGVWGVLSRHVPQVCFELLEILYNGYAVVAVALRLRRERAELLYDRYALFSFGPMCAARLGGVPLVTEVNDSVVIERSRGLVCRGLARHVERAVLRRSDVVVTVSETFRSRLVDAYGLEERKVLVTPNAIDPERFEEGPDLDLPRRLDIEGCAVLGVVGAFVPWHGLDLLVRAAAGPCRDRTDVRVLLVGDGPVRSDIEALAGRLGIAEQVRFTGFVPATSVPAYLGCMDVCLMPDSNEHGSPIKIFEYMAMGKAVVAPRYGPIEEVIDDGATGVLFAPRDENDLRSSIERLLDDAALRDRIGRAARARVLEHHTWDVNARRVLARVAEVRTFDAC